MTRFMLREALFDFLYQKILFYSIQLTGEQTEASRGDAVWLSIFLISCIFEAVWWTPQNISLKTTQLGVMGCNGV